VRPIDFVAIDHPRFHRAEMSIFTKRVVADCMTHSCRLTPASADGEKIAVGRVKLDACCQYGADTDLGERDAILTHREQIAALLRPDAAAAPWFTEDVEDDADFASGQHVRTAVHGEGCVFLGHDGRGCAIHRASIEGGWDFRGVKPHVCRLFPLTYEEDAIVLSDDHPDYSCAHDPAAPSVYRVSRETLRDVFGEALVVALDAAERAVLASPRVHLRTIAV
jgi:Fe-S-cluster containining protein